MRRPHSDSLDRFTAPKVVDAPIARFDNHGLGQEPNNLAAIGSLTGYRTLRWGCNVELILTDQRSYRSEEPTELEEAKALSNEDFPEMIPQQAMEILDSAREYNNGNPPLTIRSVDGSVEIPNVWKARPPQTVLGAEQKVWFLERLKSTKATWKIWGNTTATLDMRADPQNLPEGITRRWPWLGYAGFGGGDHSTAYIERGEIYDFVLRNGITGFATVAGDRHSFWAGLAAKALPPSQFSPVGVAFVTGSISAPGMVEALEHSFPKNHRLRALYLGQGPNDQQPQATVNMLLRHGVRSCLEYAKTGDIVKRERAIESGTLAPCKVRRYGRPWLLGGNGHDESARD